VYRPRLIHIDASIPKGSHWEPAGLAGDTALLSNCEMSLIRSHRAPSAGRWKTPSMSLNLHRTIIICPLFIAHEPVSMRSTMPALSVTLKRPTSFCQCHITSHLPAYH
jgi:hypothetical protein